jgi:cell division protein FtsN
MEFNWTTVAWIAGLLFVYIFGLLEGRSKGYKKRKAEEVQEKKDQPPLQPPPVITAVDDPGLLRIKNEDGSLTLDLDGAKVNPTRMSPEQRRRLIELLNLMRPWLEGHPVSAPAQAEPAPAQPRSTSRDQTPAAPAPVQPATASPRPAAQAISQKSATIAKEDRPSAPANSIVSQIDSILQARLAGTSLEDRGIFLTQSPEGGVAVYVGLTRYDGIDEVPDTEIKTVIRAAIAEWEQKFTPGLQ